LTREVFFLVLVVILVLVVAGTIFVTWWWWWWCYMVVVAGTIIHLVDCLYDGFMDEESSSTTVSTGRWR
jgi:F0F1-type ATP synthase assembly protein I